MHCTIVIEQSPHQGDESMRLNAGSAAHFETLGILDK